MLIGVMQSSGGFKFSKINISRLTLSISLAILIFGLLVHATDDPNKSNLNIITEKLKSSQFSLNKISTLEENKDLTQIKYQTSSHRNKIKLRRFIKKQLRHNPSIQEPNNFEKNQPSDKTSSNQQYSINSIQNEPITSQVKSNKKRCRYSDHELDGIQSKHSPNGKDSYSDQRYNQHTIFNNYKYENVPFNFIKQPRVRDQNNKQHHLGSNGYSNHIESEKIYVNVGDTINLTCVLNIKEVDWHFNGKNSSTIILTNGLQLQVDQPVIYELSQPIHQQSLNDDDYQDSVHIYRPKRVRNQLDKYKVSSDRQSHHMLTLYIQGSQDEGSYQCVDSNSETPIKKTIRVILKNNSMALTSGFSEAKTSFIFYFVSLIFIWSILKNLYKLA